MRSERIHGVRPFLVPSSWEWAVLTVCYLAIFHMFGTYAVPPLGMVMKPVVGYSFLALSILLVTTYLGWKAHEPVFVDALLGSGVYALLFEVVAGMEREYIIAVILCLSILGYGGALLGGGLRIWSSDRGNTRVGDNR